MTPKQSIVRSHRDAAFANSPQQQRMIPVITRETCGATGLSGGLVVMPPGGRSRPHLHPSTEMIVIVVEGHAATLIGEDMTPLLHGPGDFIFVPEGIPHAAVNLDRDRRLIAVEMRTDPEFNEDVVLAPQFEEMATRLADRLQEQFASGQLPMMKAWSAELGVPFTYTPASAS
jgi:uncharacterized RmlC-like cupin family protein